jgi:predicted nucleic acid-binding protein
MMVSFDTNILVYATVSVPLAQTHRAREWFAAAARATARTVTVFFAVGAATAAVLLYLGT